MKGMMRLGMKLEDRMENFQNLDNKQYGKFVFFSNNIYIYIHIYQV